MTGEKRQVVDDNETDQPSAKLQNIEQLNKKNPENPENSDADSDEDRSFEHTAYKAKMVVFVSAFITKGYGNKFIMEFARSKDCTKDLSWLEDLQKSYIEELDGLAAVGDLLVYFNGSQEDKDLVHKFCADNLLKLHDLWQKFYIVFQDEIHILFVLTLINEDFDFTIWWEILNCALSDKSLYELISNKSLWETNEDIQKIRNCFMKSCLEFRFTGCNVEKDNSSIGSAESLQELFMLAKK